MDAECRACKYRKWSLMRGISDGRFNTCHHPDNVQPLTDQPPYAYSCKFRHPDKGKCRMFKPKKETWESFHVCAWCGSVGGDHCWKHTGPGRDDDCA